MLEMEDGGGSGRRYRVGIDVGGTFTDVVLVDEASGEILVAKVPTVPADPSEGCLAGLDKALQTYGIEAGAVDVAVHGAAIATGTERAADLWLPGLTAPRATIDISRDAGCHARRSWGRPPSKQGRQFMMTSGRSVQHREDR